MSRAAPGEIQEWVGTAIAAGDDESCWEWPFARKHFGYGHLRVAGRNTAAHRWVYGLMTGRRLSSTECVLHRCDNPPCVNPHHMFLGTRRDNARDMVAKDRSPRSKITAAQAAEIERSTDKATALADRYGVTANWIRQIKRRTE